MSRPTISLHETKVCRRQNFGTDVGGQTRDYNVTTTPD